jgi:cellulose synthase/poly-beta-1,6-N-acetylglucosamine synthase-like glycosyltransferase
VLTIITCSLNKLNYNRIKTLEEHYKIVFVSPLYEDGQASDNLILVKDEKKGLAAARNKGLEKVDTKYVMMLGDDNIVDVLSINKAIAYMVNRKWVGVGFQTRLLHKKNYMQMSNNLRWIYRFTEGEREVIGTPYIYETKILKKYMYDDSMSDADDSDLGYRLKKDGYKIGYSDQACYEQGFESKESLIERFTRYGKSDYQYWNKYHKQWSLIRKIKSLLHPVTSEFIPTLAYFPFYIWIVYLRYKGWIMEAKR